MRSVKNETVRYINDVCIPYVDYDIETCVGRLCRLYVRRVFGREWVIVDQVSYPQWEHVWGLYGVN